MSVLVTIIDCDGTPCAVATERNPGESIADWAQRHRDAVAEAEANCAEGEDCSNEGARILAWDGKRRTMLVDPQAAAEGEIDAEFS